MNYHFKVAVPRGEIIALPFVYLFLFGVLAYLTLPSGQIMIFALGFVILFCLFLLTSLTTCMFSVTVNGPELRVRTSGGKKFSFTCRDIDRVVCSKKDSVKYGVLFYITIVKGKHEFTMEGKMAGFSNMAQYLLEMLEVGELKSTAVSAECKSRLKRFEKGVTSIKNLE